MLKFVALGFLGTAAAAKHASPFATKQQLRETLVDGPSWSNEPLGGCGTDTDMTDCTDAKGVHISDWDVSSITDFSNLFEDSWGGFGKVNVDLSKWDVSRGTTFEKMFYGCDYLNQDFDEWDIATDAVTTNMFQSSPKMTKVPEFCSAESTCGMYDCYFGGTCGTCDNPHAFDDSIFDSPASRVTCDEGVKAGALNTLCGSELCLPNNPICCESLCSDFDESGCSTKNRCWWNRDEGACQHGCTDKLIRDETNRVCSDSWGSTCPTTTEVLATVEDVDAVGARFLELRSEC